MEAHLVDARSGAILESVVESDLGAGGVAAAAEAQAVERIRGRLLSQVAWQEAR